MIRTMSESQPSAVSTRPSANCTVDHVGTYIRQARLKYGNITQSALSKRSGISEETIRRAEHGEIEPTLRTMIRLRDALIEFKDRYDSRVGDMIDEMMVDEDE
jgi:predicted transcriptional regulator